MVIIRTHLSCCLLCSCWLSENSLIYIFSFSSPTLFPLLFSSSFLIFFALAFVSLFTPENNSLFLSLPLSFSLPLSGTEFELLEVCLGTPEGTCCPCQDGDLRPSDISSALQDSTHNPCHIWLQDSCEGAELLVWVWYCKISCFSQWSKNVSIYHYVRPCHVFFSWSLSIFFYLEMSK